MQRPLLVVAFIVGCRPSGQQNTTARGTTSAAQPSAAAADSARADSLLQRADRARIQGDSAAPVWIVELSDFQCPYCKQWHDETYPVIMRGLVNADHGRGASAGVRSTPTFFVGDEPIQGAAPTAAFRAAIERARAKAAAGRGSGSSPPSPPSTPPSD